MRSFSPSPLSEFSWYRLSVTLVNIRSIPRVSAHPLSIIDAIIKGVNSLAFPNDRAEHLIFFHIKNRKHTFKIYQSVPVPLEIFFIRKTLSEVNHWVATFKTYLEDPETGKNFAILSISGPEERNLSRVWEELGELATEGEICLEFLTPFPFKPEKEKERTFIGKEGFIRSFERRFTRLFGKEVLYRSETDQFYLLPYYWHYTEIRHQPKSQPGLKYINGCVGKLYLKGTYKDFLPFLVLGSELHTGPKLAHGQGYYLLHKESPPHFAPHFPDEKAILSVIREVVENYDSALEYLSATKDHPFDEVRYAEEIYREIKEGTYQPTPNTAFSIKKKGSGQRIVERVSFKDLVVQEYLRKTITPVFERIFEPESIGFRKGVSREKAISLIQEAIASGYQYVIEADIEDFFPSVDPNILMKLIEFYLPKNDTLLKNLLCQSIRNGYQLEGKLYERNNGLAQGSPLSPILANLYLDAFDEKIRDWNVRLVRYADDFVILTKTKKDAEVILAKSQSFLSALGLRLKREKTLIRPIKDGFRFLGIRFERSEVVVEPEEEFKRLKKPLYITEPYLYLSVNGDALIISRNRVVLETIPLYRISEIMVMEKSLFSTALVKKCAEFNIPLTITLNTGYYITTIKPDSKRYYEIASRHCQRYYSLSETELLCFAKEIAVGKMKGYISLFRQRYQPGHNLIIDELLGTISRINQAGSLEEIRGLEGSMAKRIYQQLNPMIANPAFHIQKREREKPDPINSLLNFGYYLLFARINATLRAVGLNPYLGFLHSPSDEYESLAYDIQELFRPFIDRFIIRILNLKVISRDDFRETKDGAYLKREAVKKFIDQFEAEMVRKSEKRELSLEERIYFQVLVIKKWVLEDASLTFYGWEL